MALVEAPLKSRIKARWPRAFAAVRSAKDQLIVEARVVRQLGPLTLASAVLGSWREGWHGVLPLQAPTRIAVPGSEAFSVDALAAGLKETGLPVGTGHHTVYLPPRSLAASRLNALAELYPPDAGLKLLRLPGPADGSGYLFGTGHSAIQHEVTHDRRELTLVANLLHVRGIGPRLYDLVELETPQGVWTGYVVQHSGSGVPTSEACESLLARIRALETAGAIRMSTPGGFAHIDFAPPACNGNAVADEASGAYYVDFQNFLLRHYAHTVEQAAVAAAESTHYGDESLLRGGRYLYQSVPGIALAAKRNINARIWQFEALLRSAGTSLDRRIVLDFGCNVGMMMGQYLRLGAGWCHGWDLPTVAPHAEELLYLTGCTRFSTSGVSLERGSRPEDTLPSFLVRRLQGCVISYLAVRRHLGWHDTLGRLPWSHLLYEGHEQETLDSIDRHVGALSRLAPVRVAARAMVDDGDSTARPIAVIARLP
jgi:hypothetical protein